MLHSRNIVFTGVNQVEVLDEPVPELGPRQALLEARVSLISTGTEGICLSHLYDSGTHWDEWIKYPHHPGYSMVADVVAVGTEARLFRGRERVVSWTNHRRYNVMNEDALVPVPEGVSDEEAAWFAISLIVQNGVRSARHVLGEHVVVIGLGILGQLAVQYLRLLGARTVIAVDTAEARLEMARAHGATHCIQSTSDACREQVFEITGGLGADVVYDVTGNYRVLPDALRLLRRFGRVIVLGDTGQPSEQRLTGDLIRKGLQIIGTHATTPPPVSTDHARWSNAEMAALYFDYLRRGDIRVADLITHRYSPEEAPEAYRMLQTDRSTAMGVIFDWSRLE